MDGNDLAEPTRSSLLLRIRDPRDSAAWQSFVDTYGPMIYRYGRRRGAQDADAADLTQEVLIEVARCIRAFEYRPEWGRFRDWLGLVVRRRLARLRERTEGGAEVPCDDEELGRLAAAAVDPEWVDEFNAQVLQAALAQARPHFEPATWRAFERTWLEGRSAAETAAELGLPIEKVYVAKSRVLKRLEAEVRVLAEDVPQLIPLR